MLSHSSRNHAISLITFSYSLTSCLLFIPFQYTFYPHHFSCACHQWANIAKPEDISLPSSLYCSTEFNNVCTPDLWNTFFTWLWCHLGHLLSGTRNAFLTSSAESSFFCKFPNTGVPWTQSLNLFSTHIHSVCINIQPHASKFCWASFRLMPVSVINL